MPTLFRNKSGIFYIIYRIKGKQVWRSTRTRDRKEAYKAYLHASPSDPNSLRTKKPLYMLSACIDEYLEYVETNFAERTLEIYSVSLNLFLKFTGDILVLDFSSRMIDAYKNYRAQTVSPATVNIEVRVIRAFFNRLKHWNIIEKNPCDGISDIRTEEEAPIFLEESQLQHLLESITDPWLRNIVVFAAMTGTRSGEIMNLTWNDVDLVRGTVTVRSSISYRSKHGRLRVVPLNPAARRTVEEMPPPHEGFVFPGKKGRLANSDHVGRKFKSVARRLGLDERIHFHSLRHTFASLLVRKGASLYQVQKLLGHSSSRVTEMYAHLNNSDLHDVVNRLQFDTNSAVDAQIT